MWVRTYGTDSVSNLSPLQTVVSKKLVCVLGCFSRKLDSLIVFVSLLNELCDILSCCVPEGEDGVNESFPDERFLSALI